MIALSFSNCLHTLDIENYQFHADMRFSVSLPLVTIGLKNRRFSHKYTHKLFFSFIIRFVFLNNLCLIDFYGVQNKNNFVQHSVGLIDYIFRLRYVLPSCDRKRIFYQNSDPSAAEFCSFLFRISAGTRRNSMYQKYLYIKLLVSHFKQRGIEKHVHFFLCKAYSFFWNIRL